MNITLVKKLRKGLNKRVLVMIEAFPFFIVGTLVDVASNQIDILAEFGVPLPLKNNVFHINIESIVAVYVEEQDGEIPLPS